MDMPARLCLVGGGKMGGALLAGWLKAGLSAADVFVVEPDDATAKDLAVKLSVTVAPDLSSHEIATPPAVVVLALKPQAMDAAIPAYASFAGPQTVFLSIAAGRTIASLARGLGGSAAIVRAMPNTPAAIGLGISVACANQRVSATQKALCTSLLESAGEVAWAEDEGLLDAVTAVSGSGPAYLFLFIECLAAAGEKAGLPSPLARQLAQATVRGAAELASRSHEPVETLRRNVTSPQGTTQAALDVLMAEDGLGALLERAVGAATARSRALAD
jgi:pyrroline-5-carboxylate reductase